MPDYLESALARMPVENAAFLLRRVLRQRDELLAAIYAHESSEESDDLELYAAANRVSEEITP